MGAGVAQKKMGEGIMVGRPANQSNIYAKNKNIPERSHGVR